jgi:dTDP-4-amino-4,6-dideoxygalactose transaminase
MRAAGLSRGQEVIVPAYNWVSPVTSVTADGGIPVVVDVDPDTHLMDLGLLEAALSPRTAGVMSMHYTGRIVPPEPILDFCRQHGLFYIEDCAQAHGGAWKGRKVGSFGDAAAFSFQASKILTCGEGGLVSTNSPSIADAAHAMVDNNRQKPWFTKEVRFPEVTNSRITEFQAALLSSQMDLLEERHATREKNAAQLHATIEEIDGVSSLRPVADETRPAYWKFVILLEDKLASLSKDVFLRALMAEGIPAEPGHVPAHMHPRTLLSRENWIMVNQQEGRNGTALPVTERLATTVHVWLPHNILLGSSQDVADIATAIEKVALALQGPDNDKALELAKTTPQVWYESAEI